MGSRVLDVLAENKRNTKKDTVLQNLKITTLLKRELIELLKKYLENSDKVMIEVDSSIASNFIALLATGEFSLYFEYKQEDYNKFVFWDKIL